MRTSRLFLLCCFVFGQSLAGAASPPIEYLRYMYGADEVVIEQVCWPNDDVWMMRGVKNPEGLAEIAKLELKHGKSEIIWEMIQNGLCIVELRDGKVDPAFNLDQIYFRHRELAVRFIYAALQHDKEQLEKLVTHVANIHFGRTKAAPDGDMDVYSELIARMPILRVSKPADDKVSRSVTYRLPLGASGTPLRMIKRGRHWLIDSEQRLEVPLEIFHR